MRRLSESEAFAAFWSKVDKLGPIPPHEPALGSCWVWLGATREGGYGSLRFHGRNVSASRLSWEWTCGPIADGMWVLHRCDNPPCVRPSHLFLGTAQDNARDRDAKGRNYQVTQPEKLSRGERHWTSTHPELIRRAERGTNAKLTWDQVARIRTRAVNEGLSSSALGAEFGVSARTIRFILRGETWKQ